jgi:hypothetical protein
LAGGHGFAQVSVALVSTLPPPFGVHEARASTVCVPVGTLIGTVFDPDEPLNVNTCVLTTPPSTRTVSPHS